MLAHNENYPIQNQILSNRGLISVVTLLACYYMLHTTSFTSFASVDHKLKADAYEVRDKFHNIAIYIGPGNPIDSILSSLPKTLPPYSQARQDEIVLELTREINLHTIGTQHTPYFIDLAANDAAYLSNSLRLEENGWHGLCIEPNPTYWHGLAHRKCKVAGTFVGGKETGKAVNVSLDNGVFGGIVGTDMDNKPVDNVPRQRRFTIGIRSLFKHFDVPSTIDYMSLDIEGAEELVMQDFPFKDYKIMILTVERPKLELQALLKSNGYVFISMLIEFGDTLWMHENSLQLLDLSRAVAITNSYIKSSKDVKRRWNVETAAWGSVGTARRII